MFGTSLTLFVPSSTPSTRTQPVRPAFEFPPRAHCQARGPTHRTNAGLTDSRKENQWRPNSQTKIKNSSKQAPSVPTMWILDQSKGSRIERGRNRARDLSQMRLVRADHHRNRCGGARRLEQQCPSAVVMHPGRCHAQNVPGTELDGKCGQRGRGGNHTSRLFSVI